MFLVATVVRSPFCYYPICYGCIQGYPNKTYRGNRSLTRYEFGAGVNACLDRMNELIATSTAELVRNVDLLAVQKLQQEFATELATLRSPLNAEPDLTHFNGGNPQPFKTDIPLHIEALYQYQLTPNISLTSGLVWLTAPNQDNRNSIDVITTLRARFTF